MHGERLPIIQDTPAADGDDVGGLYDVFLDLHNFYDTLDCGCFLDIIAACSVGHRSLRLLWRYWDCLIMVARAVGYYGVLFKGKCGFTQGRPLSSIIFNVVVFAALQYWVLLVVEAEVEAGPEGFDRDVQRSEAYFYVDDGLISST